MSGIIFGNIRFNNKIIDLDSTNKVLEAINHYKFDKYKYIKNKEYYIGCALQYITEESLSEIIPYEDKEAGLIITADAIIDNREELLLKLDLKNNNISDFSDSEYILMAYKRWGIDCPKYLLGDFTFSIWDVKKQQLFCARDQVGKRCFYYYYNNEEIIFSTLLKPIINVLGKKEKNERWLAENLAIMGALSSCSNETMYKNVFKLPPATSMIVSKDKIIFNKYWDPINHIKEVHYDNEKEYEIIFKETLMEAVKCRLRTNSEVGIMLSSGLDSTSVGCLAAKLLSENNKKLYSFTSVPLVENNNIKIEGRCINETEGVKIIANQYKNIKTNFCELRGFNSVSSLDMINDILEGPYKTIENIYWYIGLAIEASKNNCKVLLDGQFGNLTISYGEYYTYLLTLIKNMRFIKVKNELKLINKKYKIRKKDLCKQMIKLVTPYSIRKKMQCDDRYKWTPINQRLILKYDINTCLDSKNLNMFPAKYRDWSETKRLIVNNENLSHLGEYETKVSLYTGLVKRDPTKDVRVIEMILSFPIDEFLRYGNERSLIKRAMVNIVPNEILDNKLFRGVQAADWLQRLRNDWDDLYTKLNMMISDEIISNYFDIDKLKIYIDKFKRFKESYSDIEKYEIRTLLSAFVFYNYLIKEFKK